MDKPGRQGADYVVPLDKAALWALMLRWATLTAIQFLTVAGTAVLIVWLIGSIGGSLRAALPWVALLALIGVMAMGRVPGKWRQMRASAAHPPALTDRGVRLRLVSTSGYDLLVPWERVSKVSVLPARTLWPRRWFWELRIQVEDVEELVADDPGRLRAVQAIGRPAGMAFVYATSFVQATLEELDAALRRSSDGRCALAV